VDTAEGQGARFRIALPLAPEALDSQHPDDEPEVAPATADQADADQPHLA